MANEKPAAAPLCPRCGNEPVEAGRFCRNCGWSAAVAGRASAAGTPPEGAADTLQSVWGPAPQNTADIHRGSKQSFSLATLLLAVSGFAILMAIFVAAPGLGILLGIFAVPPFVRTAAVIRKRRQLGYETGQGSGILLFFGSMMVTWVVVLALLISCSLTFFGVCLVGVSLPGLAGNEQAILTFSFLAVGVCALLVLYLAFRVIRWRYRLDVDPARFGPRRP